MRGGSGHGGKTAKRALAGATLGVAFGFGSAGCSQPAEILRPDDRAPASALAPSPPAARAKDAPPAPAPGPPLPGADDPEATVALARWLPAAHRWAIAQGNVVRLVAPETGDHTDIAPEAGPVSLLTVGLRGDALAVAAGGSYLGVFRPDGALVAQVPSVHDTDESAVALSADGKRVALVGARLRVWEVPGGALVADIELPSPNWWQAAFHQDGQHVVLAGSPGALVVDLTGGTLSYHATDTAGTFPTVVSPDGRFIAAAAAEGHSLRVYRSIPWGEVAMLGHASSCAAHIGVAFSDDGKRLLGRAGTAWLRLYETGSFRLMRAWKPAAGLVAEAEMSDDGAMALAIDDDRGRFVNPRSGLTIAAVAGQVGGSLLLSADGSSALQYGPQGYLIRSTKEGRVTAAWPPIAP